MLAAALPLLGRATAEAFAQTTYAKSGTRVRTQARTSTSRTAEEGLRQMLLLKTR